MLPTEPRCRTAPDERCGGFTLLEILGVLAVIAILGVFVAQSAIVRMRDEARRSEHLSLVNMSQALRDAVPRQRGLPAAVGLSDLVALELQIPPDRAEETPQGHRRRFLLDPALRLGTNINLTAPYTQSAAGSLQPVSPRGMIVSCLARDVPSDLNFDTVWDLAKGTVPAGMNVDAEDFFVQRLDLRGVFHRLILNNVDRDHVGLYAIDGFGHQWVEVGTRREAWFFHGTTVTLYYANGDLQAREVLMEDTSYVHEHGQWGRQVIYGGRPAAGSFGELVEAFLNAPPPSDPKFGANQQAVIDEFYEYMWTYAIWAMGSPPAVAQFEKGGTTSDTQVPPFRILNDCDARMAAFTNNLID
ncbi:MAG: type II secretion system protein [Verrucomicrobiae bacterium]|nr:type II secretion system protein [Verrucomicrobiae bacterium]